jgi:serine/threonine protein kinase
MNEPEYSLRRIFTDALDVADAAERAAFVQRACGTDAELRHKVEALLRAHEQAGGFLNPPVAAESARSSTVLVAEPATEKAGEAALRRFGDYELLEEIARGGMGIVYRARQLSVDRIVAVKMILAGEFASREQALRFRAEAEAAARLQHPNIVRIHEAGQRDGQPYFSMEYVQGGSLASLIREKPLPAKRAAGYVKTIAEAIHYAHEQGILHRDLKPSNILLDNAGQLRVTDFGLAKRFVVPPAGGRSAETVTQDETTGVTLPGQVLGSPNFLSPEQAAADHGHVTQRTDVYGLGAILYHLLTGRPPFRGESTADTLHQVMHQEPTPPRLVNAGVPVDLDSICLKCLEKDPANRYASAAMVAEDLARFENGESITARPVAITNFKELLWADENFSRGYREMADIILPDRQRLYQVLRSFFRHHLAGRRSLRVCDLGCGDGALAAELLAVDPTIILDLVDGSPEMLAVARQRFGERPNTTYLDVEFDAIIRQEVRFGPFDFIMSSFAIHHLHHAEKAVLFQRLIDGLQPGGWFLNIDVVLPDQELLTGWLIELWRDQILEAERRGCPPRTCRNVPEESWNNPDNKYATLGLQLKALRTAGFTEVDCHYRNGIFGIYTGRKPAAP